MTASEPTAMTLSEFLSLAAERKWDVTFYGHPSTCLIVDDFGDDIAHEGWWPEAASAAVGSPVVERDEAAELRAAVREWAEAEAAYRDALNGFEPSPLTAAIKSLHRATDNLRRLAGMEDEK